MQEKNLTLLQNLFDNTIKILKKFGKTEKDVLYVSIAEDDKISWEHFWELLFDVCAKRGGIGEYLPYAIVFDDIYMVGMDDNGHISYNCGEIYNVVFDGNKKGC